MSGGRQHLALLCNTVVGDGVVTCVAVVDVRYTSPTPRQRPAPDKVRWVPGASAVEAVVGPIALAAAVAACVAGPDSGAIRNTVISRVGVAHSTAVKQVRPVRQLGAIVAVGVVAAADLAHGGHSQVTRYSPTFPV